MRISSDPPENRVPVEIWERILLDVVSVESALVFAGSCSASDYLLFKRTCGDNRNDAYQDSYRQVERDRHRFRLVCHTWKNFTDRWDLHARWIRLPFRHSKGGWEDEMWRGVLRVDIDYARGSNPAMMLPVLSTWKSLGSVGGRAMQLTRLEILRVEPNVYNNLFRALCDAAQALQNLRSLGLVVLHERYTILEKLAIHFPELTHLTLCLHQAAQLPRPDDPKPERPGSSRLAKLEVLFLFPTGSWGTDNRMFDMKHWVLPSLRHFQIHPVNLFWHPTYAFLKRHATSIETLDLDPGANQSIGLAYRGTGPKSVVIPVDFWDTFVRLKVLRYNWDKTGFLALPKVYHAIECIALADSMESVGQFTDVLRTWVKGGDSKVLESIVLYGSYLKWSKHMVDTGVAKGLLQQADSNGTRLVSPAGQPWPIPK